MNFLKRMALAAVAAKAVDAFGSLIFRAAASTSDQVAEELAARPALRNSSRLKKSARVPMTQGTPYSRPS